MRGETGGRADEQPPHGRVVAELRGLAEEHLARRLGQQPHRQAHHPLAEPEPAGDRGPVERGQQHRRQELGGAGQQRRGRGIDRVLPVLARQRPQPPPRHREQRQPLHRRQGAQEVLELDQRPQAVAQDQPGGPMPAKPSASWPARLAHRLDQLVGRVDPERAAPDRPVVKRQRQPVEQHGDGQQPQERHQVRHGGDARQPVAAEPDAERRRERHRDRGRVADADQLDRLPLVARHRHGELVAQRRHHREDGGEAHEHGEAAERLRGRRAGSGSASSPPA